ncbi:NYN domain-containing protein [Aliishimia ponticola]|uniref:NYN domain-containing protein n=1 Tax=Aliishimia ponticola TaxID=2499833 RepID=A0A4S4N6K0_9RHOB|nr:NYN domain-containing protein [Aliishimia ponticola]THH34766.1 NYN domain-containing protein [Aliishimia ponticola]
MTARTALYVDGDNLGAGYGPQILELARQAGRLDIARVYADFGKTCGWNNVPGVRTCHAGTGKNASDLLLAVDAMQFAHTAGITTHVIATSDGDFSHLALRLREIGHTVIGIGEAKAPDKLTAACSTFHKLAAKTRPPCAQTRTGEDITQMDQHIRAIIAAGSQEGRGLELQKMAQKMQRQHGIKLSDLTVRTWRSYLSARPTLYELDPPGPGAKVRFKQNGFNGAT